MAARGRGGWRPICATARFVRATTGMRRTLLLVATLAVAAVAACDLATDPTIAGLSGDGGTGTGGGTGTNTGSGGGGAVVTTLTVAPSSATIVTGSSIQLITNVFDDQVRWESSAPNVAAVSPSGMVVALTPGTAIIRVVLIADTTRTASSVITVVAAP